SPRSADPEIVVAGAEETREQGEADDRVQPLLDDFAVHAGHLDDQKGENGGHHELPDAFDPDVDDVPPVQLVEREVDRIVDREQPEEGDAPHSEEQHGRDRRPPAFQYGGRYVVEKDQRHDHDSQLDPHGLLEEFAASVNSEQIADHRRQRAEHQQAELNVGQNRALDLALRLFGNEVVGGTEEAHQQPHDQRVGVDHSQDIEGKYLGQKVGKDVNDARQHTE